MSPRDRHSDHGRLGIAVEAWVTGDIQDPDDPAVDDMEEEHLSAGIFKKGWNWETYKRATVAHGATAADWVEIDEDHVEITKSAVIPFLGLFDIVFINHGVPPRVIYKCKQHFRSVARQHLAPNHWVFQFAKDDFPTGPAYGGWENVYHDALFPKFVMRGAGVNAEGSNCVDPDEGVQWKKLENGLVVNDTMKDILAVPSTQTVRPSNVSAHSWLIDYVRDENGVKNYKMAEVLAKAASDDFFGYWNAGGAEAAPIDGFIFHDLNGYFSPRTGGGGGATNKPTFTDLEWHTGSNKVHAEMKKRFGKTTQADVWHGAGSLIGSRADEMLLQVEDTHRHHANFCFGDPRLTREILLAAVARAASRTTDGGDILVLGNQEPLSGWVDDEMLVEGPLWFEILEKARSCRNTGKVFVSMGITSNSPLFWSPALRPVF